MKKEIISSILVAIIGIMLFTYLLIRNYIGASSYVTLIFVLSFVSLVILVRQRLKELDLKNLKLTLDKIEEAKTEIFAKEEDFKESTLLLAELITANTAVTGIWGDKDSHKYSKELIEKKTKDLLQRLKIPSSKIEEIFKYQKALDDIPEEAGEEHDKKWKEFIAMLKKESGN